jgi:hypothetical protein
MIKKRCERNFGTEYGFTGQQRTSLLKTLTEPNKYAREASDKKKYRGKLATIKHFLRHSREKFCI